nr:MAG TPA: hypothetical protein [Caudoviricetes sp.]
MFLLIAGLIWLRCPRVRAREAIWCFKCYKVDIAIANSI